MEEKIGYMKISAKSEVPEPLPKTNFMLWIGPVMMTEALGLGTSEVILYPNLTLTLGISLKITAFGGGAWQKNRSTISFEPNDLRDG